MLKLTETSHVSAEVIGEDTYKVDKHEYPHITFAEAIGIYDPFQTDYIEHNFTLEDYVLCFGTNLSIHPKGSGK